MEEGGEAGVPRLGAEPVSRALMGEGVVRGYGENVTDLVIYN